MARRDRNNAVSSQAGAWERVARRARGLHRDEGGSLSIVSVFALMMLVLLLGMVMNSSRQVDQKVKLQNAADSATYAGGVVLSRNMNTLAFTNHLLADVFALTAYFREARDRSSESLTPEILNNWQRVAPAFQGSEFPPFDQLGYAIEEKVPGERDMVFTFSEWSYAAAEMMLPVFEEILAQRMIPEFQRALTEATPALTQYAADEVARRHGQAWPLGTELRAVIWRTNVDPVGGISETARRTLPVVDPVMDVTLTQEQYMSTARRQRDGLAHHYLRVWNDDTLQAFDEIGKMSQFSNLWRIFTCGQLTRLLEVEYPTTNLPFQIRDERNNISDVNGHLEGDFMFVGVVYRQQLPSLVPGVFRNPIGTDTQAYSQIMMFVPRRRLIKVYPGSPSSEGTLGGVPGEGIPRPVPPTPRPPPPSAPGEPVPWSIAYQSEGWHPHNWNLINQNWTMQLVPATTSVLPAILSTPPDVNGVTGFETPDLLSLTQDDLRWISHH
ncbi:MAG: pilus assembly protein TadG-related protein [Planctomycetota bacterium]|nr:pilus assembly protein TadG-related protein [Planctomycetota bacterium]